MLAVDVPRRNAALLLTTMASLPITIEHPQLTQRFIVNVPASGTIQDIKRQISLTCPGNPQVEGQRLIAKGRVLDDGENVAEVWNVRSSFESHTFGGADRVSH
jgi:hypothetical protein